MSPKRIVRFTLVLVFAALIALPSAAFAAPARGESTAGDLFGVVRQWVLTLWPAPSAEVRRDSRPDGKPPVHQPNLSKRGCSIDPQGQPIPCV
jgi:hypothetical protein